MAVLSRIARLRVSRAVGDNREWTATAAVQDTAAGSSVVVTTMNVATGGTAPADADTLTLNFYNDAGGLVRTVALSTSAASQTTTFFFTTNGLSGGGDRCGTIEIALRATKTTGGPTETYDAETDGAPATPVTAGSLQTDRGWIRGTTTAVQVLSNVALGGAKNAPAAYVTPVAGDGGDSLFVRTTLGVAVYVARTLTVGLSHGSLSGPTNSTTGPVFDISHTSVVDNRFPAASTVVVTSVTVPNATLTGQPFTAFTTTTTDSMPVDPRITRTPLFQLDNNTFATPPLFNDVSDHRRRNSQQGFLASRSTNARGEGVNGLTYSVSLTPVAPGTPVSQTGLVTTTQGGQDGWAPSFLAWSSSLPGGRWDKSASYTAPADILGASYVVQAAGTNTIYTLIARNDDYDARVNVNHVAGLAGRHFEAGMKIAVVAYVIDVSTQKRVAGATFESVRCSLVRTAPGDIDGLSNTFQFFDGTAWVNWTPGTAQTVFTLTASPVDPDTFERQFADTTSFGERDFRANVQIAIGGVTYLSSLVTPNLATKNRHDGQTFDPIGLFA